MSVAALREFLTAQIARAKAEDVLFSLHLKATMMKVSDPIIFGHAVRAFFPKTFAAVRRDAGRGRPDPERRPRRHPQAAWTRCRDERARSRRPFEAELADGPAPGDGRLRPRHHQPARAERRHRRRLDAGHDPHLRPHVGPGRQGGRHARRHPGQQLRRHLPGRHRRLPRQRRLRPRDHGLGAQRRPDGAGGRGVRQPRQDLRDPAPPARCAWSTQAGNVVLEHAVGAGRHLAHVPDQGRADPRLGQARRHPRPRHRRPGGVLAGRDARARREPDRQGQGVPARARHRAACRSRSWRRTRRSRSRWSASARARTRSRSPATCCATT